MHCQLPAVRDLYLKRWKENDWDEKEDRDSRDFLELEKEIYLEMHPQNADLFEDEEEEVEKEQAEEKKKKDGEQAKKKKVGGGGRQIIKRSEKGASQRWLN